MLGAWEWGFLTVLNINDTGEYFTVSFQDKLSPNGLFSALDVFPDHLTSRHFWWWIVGRTWYVNRFTVTPTTFGIRGTAVPFWCSPTAGATQETCPVLFCFIQHSADWRHGTSNTQLLRNSTWGSIKCDLHRDKGLRRAEGRQFGRWIRGATGENEAGMITYMQFV